MSQYVIVEFGYDGSSSLAIISERSVGYGTPIGVANVGKGALTP